jgi:hypothetical protein
VKYALLLAVLLLTACHDDSPRVPTYKELVEYKTDCTRAPKQLAYLRWVQNEKAFDPDPEQLDEVDRVYNSRLKATIWWYSYSCEQS